MRMRIFVSFVSFLLSFCIYGDPWSKVYHTVCDQKKMACRQLFSNEIVVMEHKDLASFSQLLISWNAHRPSLGYFSFFVQVRNKTTKKWGVWHHMYDWGAGGIQASYKQKSDGVSRYEYVRLELVDDCVADGFRVKVKLQKNVCAKNLISVTGSCALYNDFREEDPRRYANFSSVCVQGVSQIAQFALDHPDSARVCSPVSLTMLLRYLHSASDYPELYTVIEQSYDKGLCAYGSWPFNIACAFDMLQGKYGLYVCRLNSFSEVHERLMHNIPVVVSVRGPLEGAERPYAGGHLLLIVGWDIATKSVICHDPAFDTIEKTLKHYPIASFLAAWERSRRLAYCVMESKIIAA